MKKILFFVIALLPVFALAQNLIPFSIKGKLGNLNAPSRAYLIYQLGANQTIDSALITNGNFNFTGKILNPINAVLIIDRTGVGIARLDSTADALNFFIDKGDMAVTAADSIAKGKITGSQINDDNAKLTADLLPLYKKANEIHAEAMSASEAQKNSAEFQNGIQAKFKELQIQQTAIFKVFVSSHTSSYLSLLILNSLTGPSADASQIGPLYDSLSADLKTTEMARSVKQKIDVLKTTGIGAMAKDFTQTDVNGTPVALSSFRGKYVLIDFWASWCGPCRQENPNVVKAYNKYKTKNFTILGVSLDRTSGKADWLAAIKSDGLTWTEVSDLKFWNNEAAMLYNVQSIPANFLIDPTGKIIARDLRGDDLENKLAELFGK